MVVFYGLSDCLADHSGGKRRPGHRYRLAVRGADGEPLEHLVFHRKSPGQGHVGNVFTLRSKAIAVLAQERPQLHGAVR